MRAELQEKLIAGFVEIARVLQLPQQDAQDQTLIVEAVKTWLNTHEGWLLILDNADDLTVARELLPSGTQGHVLLTTRAAAMGQIAQAVELKKMSHHDGALFLLRRAKRIADQAEWEAATEADRQVALEIAQEMDGLPLALDQAGAYAEEMMLSLTEYLNLYRQEGAKLLAERGELATDHDSVTVTFRLAFAKVEERSRAAADLLRVCAFLAPDDIPEEIFTAGASVLAEPLRTVAANALDFAKAVREAGRFSLIERNSSNQTLNIHRLVQEVLRDEMEPAIWHGWLEQAIKVLNQAFPEVEFKDWPLCERLLPHVIVLSNFENVDASELIELGLLFNQAGVYLLARGVYSLSRALIVVSSKGDPLVLIFYIPQFFNPNLLSKIRPVVVISQNAMNRNLETIVVCPLTSKLHPTWRSRLQIDCAGKAAEIALDRIRTISQQRLKQKIDRLSDESAAQLRQLIVEMYGT